MRLAIIDCGTNTFNLLIVSLSGTKQYTKIFGSRIAVKLGEGHINKGVIGSVAFQRGIEAIKVFSAYIQKHNASKTLAFGTSAIRDAVNGNEFVKEVHKQTEINLQIIDGNREAELIYIGCKEAVGLTTNTSLIMDIGGGSNEFILANNNGVIWKQSFAIGAARLLEKFSPSNQITTNEILQINNYLSQQLQPLFQAIKEHNPIELIGSSGAFDSVVDIIHGEYDGEPMTDEKTCYLVNLKNYFQVSERIKNSTLAERKKIKGLVAMRLDMIVISCIMVDFILNAFQISQLRVSTYSLKEGAVIDYMQQSITN